MSASEDAFMAKCRAAAEAEGLPFDPKLARIAFDFTEFMALSRRAGGVLHAEESAPEKYEPAPPPVGLEIYGPGQNDYGRAPLPEPEPMRSPAPIAIEIPAALRIPDLRFILVKKGDKSALEKGWQNENNYSHDDPRLAIHLAGGGNYGIFPAPGSGIAILDADDYAGCAAAGLLQAIEGTTLTIETGGSKDEARKYHYFFRVSPPFEGKYPLVTEDGTHIGELYCQHPKSAKGYVVGPGSLHPSGERYRIAADLPILDIDHDAYGVRLLRLKRRAPKPGSPAASKEASESLSKRLRLKVTDFLMPENAKERDGEWEGAHPCHPSETGTNYTCTDEKWFCRRHETGGGPLEAFAVAAGIIDCSEAGPGCLKDPEIWAKVIAALKEKGYDVDPPASANDEAKPKKKAKPLPPFCYKHPRYGVSLDVAKIAEHLAKELHVISFNKTLYVHHEGLYAENKGQIEKAIRIIVNESGTNEQLTRINREVMTHLLAIEPYTSYPFDQAPGRIPVQNGVIHIDFASGKVTLEPHGPEHRFTYKLPVIYDPEADGTVFHEHVISQYVDDEQVAALYQIPACALLQAAGVKPYKRAYILHGDANGGKSTYLEILTSLVGVDNVAGASLQQIGTDRFVNGALEGKVLNICDDLEDVPLKNVGPFKTLTGIHMHQIERKHANPYQGRITAVHVYTCNQPPEVNERFTYDDAFWVRWVYLHFDNVFEVDPGFNEQWITPENLSGFLNLVLEAMLLIHRQGLIIKPDASETKQAWTIASDPFARFVAAEMRPADREEKFDKDQLLKAFVKWCEDHDVPGRKIPRTANAMSRSAFKNDFRTARRGKDYYYAARKRWNSGSIYAPTAEDEAAGSNQTLGDAA